MKIIKKIILILIIIVITVILASQSVLAAAPPIDTNIVPPSSVNPNLPPSSVNTTNNSVPPTLKNPIKANNIQKLLSDIVDLAIVIGMVMAVLMFIWIGFKFVMAQGNETKLKEAKMWFLYAVIGTAILISARVITSVVENTLTSAGIVDERLFK